MKATRTYRRLLAAIALLTAWPAASQTTTENDFGIWSSVNVSKQLGGRWEIYLRGEYRTRDLSRSTNLWFVRPGVSYKPLTWLKLTLSYDFLRKPAIWQHRAVFDIAATLKSGNLTCTLRERFIAAYAPHDNEWSWLVRTRATAKYRIADTRFAPYLSFELYANRHWTMMHNFAGVDIDLSHGSSLDVFYMFGLNQSVPRQDHILGLGYNLKL